MAVHTSSFTLTVVNREKEESQALMMIFEQGERMNKTGSKNVLMGIKYINIYERSKRKRAAS